MMLCVKNFLKTAIILLICLEIILYKWYVDQLISEHHYFHNVSLLVNLCDTFKLVCETTTSA